MNSKIFIVAVGITIVALTAGIFILTPRGWKANLVSPGFNPLVAAIQKSNPEPSPSPNIKTPKEFKFDATTDLKMELEKVNPEVLDSDFE